ncbi:MAG: Mut7-C RNAse domain-containing protein [Armatimonadetes bacterium]|nr:Mut7-C RNAse domain-containing protein [Armatimonadota bacterium]
MPTSDPPPRFAADSNVGRLARWLRILGYDVTYDAFIADAELVRQALAEERIILTRDNGIVQRKAARRCVFVRDDHVEAQLRQVISECSLHLEPDRFWTRCPMDNAETHPVAKCAVADRVPPYTFRTHDHFSECPRCRRVYWRGSHLDRFRRRLAQVAGFEEGETHEEECACLAPNPAVMA